jgi:hypothetical protein
MATKNLFGGEDDASSQQQSAGPPGMTRLEEREEAPGTWGPRRGFHGITHLPYDYTAAVADRPVAFGASTDRSMTPVEAADRLIGLMRNCQVVGQSDATQMAFHKAILLAHAKNSGSILQPGRAEFWVEGSTKMNFFFHVVAYLGNDTRRFFRAYADLSRNLLQDIVKSYQRGEERHVEDYNDVMWVAMDRGLKRYPYLIADSSDACSNLTAGESTAVRQAKAGMLANTPNVVDLVEGYKKLQNQSFAGPVGTKAPAQLQQAPDY